MFKFIIASFLALTFLVGQAPLVLAQETPIEEEVMTDEELLETEGEEVAEPIFSNEAVEPLGNLQCFDYYTFGSVKVAINSATESTVPGTKISFRGNVINENSYPLVNGTLAVKIFRRDNSTMEAGNGNPIVDQFIIKDGVSLAAKASLPVTFDWRIPLNAKGGEYYAAYFFNTEKQYSISGLIFSDDVIGGQSPFRVSDSSNSQPAELQKNGTTLNGVEYIYVDFPPAFEKNEVVVVTTTISNPTDKPKNIPLQWNQYAWDAQREENLRNTKTELVTLAPNETKEVTYTAVGQPESVVFITATAQDLQSKSILNIRFVRTGVLEAKTTFFGLNKFPFVKGDSVKMFACANAINSGVGGNQVVGANPAVINNTNIYELTLVLKDEDGTVLSNYTYKGSLTDRVEGFGIEFIADKNYNKVTIESTLILNGVEQETQSITYDCAEISGSCTVEEEPTEGFFHFLMKHIVMLVVIGVVLLLVIIGLALYMKQKSQSGPNIVVSLVLFILVGLFFGVGHVEAKSVITGNNIFPGLSGSLGGNQPVLFNFDNANVQVTYHAHVRNVNTGLLLSDGDNLPVGTVIRFEPKVRVPNNTVTTPDIFWWTTGGVFGTPNGYWGPWGRPVCQGTFSIPSGGATDAPDWDWFEGFSPLYIPIVPEVIIPSGGLTNVGLNTYRIDSGPTVGVEFRYPPVTGIFRINAISQFTPCYYTGNQISVPIPQEVINFTFNVSGGGGGGGGAGVSVPRPNPMDNWGVVGAAPAADFSLFLGLADETRCTFGVCGPYTFLPNPNAYYMTPSDACAYAVSVSGLPNNVEKTCSYESYSNSGYHSIIMGTPVFIPGSVIRRVDVYSGNEPTQPSCNIPLGATVTVGGVVDHSTCMVFNYPGAVIPTPPTPPTPPVINGPVTGTVGTSYNFDFTATDPDGDQIKYGIDWNGDMMEDQWAPAGGAAFVNSGLAEIANYSWGSVGSSTFRARTWDNQGNSSGWTTHTINLSVAPVPTANLTVNGSDGPLEVNAGGNLNIVWSSSNATACTASGAGWSGSVGLSGNVNIPATFSGDYIITCDNGVSASSEPPVTVTVNNLPVMQPITGPVSGFINQNLTFNFQGTDPGDTLTYEIDWNNDGIPEDMQGPFTTGFIYDGVRQWGVVNSYTFQARARDSKGAVSGWQTKVVNITLPPAPVITQFEVRSTPTNPAWVSGSVSINPGEQAVLRWNVTDATSCIGAPAAQFNTAPANNPTNATNFNITEPAPATSLDYVLTCVGPGGTTIDSIRISTLGRPNYSQPSILPTLSTGFDPITGEYDSVTIDFSTTNDGGSVANSATAAAQYRVRMDRNNDGYDAGPLSGSITDPLPVSSTHNGSVVFTNIPFGDAKVEVEVDTKPPNPNGQVVEANENDNIAVYNFTGVNAIPPPNPGLDIVANPALVRSGETAQLTWDTVGEYPGLVCSVVGPGVNLTGLNPTTFPGTRTTPALTAKSIYDFSCTVAGATFTDSVAVEVTTELEEI